MREGESWPTLRINCTFFLFYFLVFGMFRFVYFSHFLHISVFLFFSLIFTFHFTIFYFLFHFLLHIFLLISYFLFSLLVHIFHLFHFHISLYSTLYITYHDLLFHCYYYFRGTSAGRVNMRSYKKKTLNNIESLIHFLHDCLCRHDVQWAVEWPCNIRLKDLEPLLKFAGRKNLQKRFKILMSGRRKMS